MNSMYDILNKMKLLEGKGSKPDFLDLDKDGNRTEPMKAAAKEVDEASYSAKAARAGKDIGKPGKTFAKIAKGAAERYGSKERGEKVAGAVLAKMRAKESMEEDAAQGLPFDSNKIVQVLKQYQMPKTQTGRFDDPMKHHASVVRTALLHAFNEGPQEGLRVFRNASYGRLDPGYDGEGYQSLNKPMVMDAFEEINNFLKQHGIDIRSSDRKQAGLPAESAMDEGNDFTGARLAAIRAGKPTFKVGDKTYKVTGDTSDEKVMEREYGQRDDFDKYARPGDTIRTTKGTMTKTATGVKHAQRPADDEEAAADAPKRGRGRPKGKDKGPERVTAKAWKHKGGRVKESELEEGMSPASIKQLVDELADIRAAAKQAQAGGQFPQGFAGRLEAVLYPVMQALQAQHTPVQEDRDEEVDAGEFGREGDMAKEQMSTIDSAAEELTSILSDEQDLPEWVQKKITLAMDYIDTARDYMKSQGGEAIAEKAPPGAKAERMVKHIKKSYAKDGKLTDREKAIAYATAWKAKKAGKVEEESTETRDERAEKAGRRVAKDIEYDEKVKDKIHGKKRGSEDSKAERAGKKVTKDIEHDEKVDETTVAGSVATAPTSGKAKGIFGKGVYESKLEESYKSRLETMLTEGMSVNMSADADGKKSLTVTATDEDAVKLSQILTLAGMEQGHDHHEVCPACGQDPCGCDSDMMEEDLANAPDEVYASTELIKTQGDDLHKRKSTGQTTLPTPYIGADRQQSMARVYEEVKAETETRLWDLYKRYESK